MTKVIRDPIWGDIKLSRTELRVVDTHWFQRLRGVKQLGLAYLVYPGATHTRFLHSIGTVQAAQRILTAMNGEGVNFDNDTIETVRMVALLHDIGHFPFAHLLVDEMGIYPTKHDDPSHIKPILEAISESVPDVSQEAIEILQEGSAPADRSFIRDAVSNTVCADLVDYIQRDGYFTGATGLGFRFDDRLLGYFRIAPDKNQARRLAIEPVKDKIRLDVVTDLLQLLRYRYILTERVTYHHAKLAASAMLAKIVTLAGPPKLDSFAGMSDDKFIEYLCQADAESKIASTLIEKLRMRRLHKPVFRVTRRAVAKSTVKGFASKYGSPEGRKELESRILDEASRLISDQSLAEGDIILYTSPDYKMTFKATRVFVRWKGDEAVPLREVTAEEYWETAIREEVQALENKYGALWTAYVFIDPSLRHFAYEIEKACERALDMENDPLLSRSLSKEETYSDMVLAQKLLDDTRIVRTAVEISQRTKGDFTKEERLRRAVKEAMRLRGVSQTSKEGEKRKSETLEQFDDESGS